MGCDSPAAVRGIEDIGDIVLSLSAAHSVAQIIGNLGLRFQSRDELDEIICQVCCRQSDARALQIMSCLRCGGIWMVSVSAGDGMAKFLGECDNVTLMGLTSSGGVNQNNGGRIYLTKNLSICYPDYLTLSSEGVPLIDTDHTRENRIPLEVKIPMTKEFALKLSDFGAGDVQLEYAADYLAKMKKEKETDK